MSDTVPDSVAALRTRAQPVVAALLAAGGRPLVVGGAVRDALRGSFSSDIDIEVYHLEPDALLDTLIPLGKLNAVGRSFGVLKLRLADGCAFDITIPQRDNRNTHGGRGVLSAADPHMTPHEAASRRDFTWNALAITPEGELLDFFDGVEDLHNGVIRHISNAFAEDPVRVLRAMQFAARFDMQFAPATAAYCQTLLPLASTIAPERVWGEWAKWALGSYPRAGLQALHESGWVAHFPELAALCDCVQSPEHHPEGDVWAHVGFVCTAAAQIATRDQLATEPRRVLLFAALCHDLGKPATTQLDQDGRIRSRGHAVAGVAVAKALLGRIGAPQAIIEQVLPLVREHMAHYGQPTPRTLRRLAARLAPSSIGTWAQLVEADHSGRPPRPPRDPARDFVTHAHELGILDSPPAPVLTGRDLLTAGYTHGPGIGRLLRDAYQAQLDGTFTTVEEGLVWLRNERL